MPLNNPYVPYGKYIGVELALESPEIKTEVRKQYGLNYLILQSRGG